MKESVASFLSNILAVILGIFITFTIQGMIDRSRDRKNARSSLELVRSELVRNIDDVSIIKEYLDMEKESAAYFIANKDSLDKCPDDSISYHSGILFADVSMSLSMDALELLKMSSVFQKLGNNDLSMKIIRAYDCCGSIVSNVNRHISIRDSRYESAIDMETVGEYVSEGSIDIRDFIKTDYGRYAIEWLTNQPGIDNITDVSDLEDAIEAINHYLK
ncbi:MAG: hypothetical protein K6F06_11235 [Bacteroidales bacterium]|nr:hypothetical protein [Bacteroidales bacterium]